ncbi:MAG: Gfo/Idh/MocA family oxidoreductase [Eubacteriales bacterium]
MKYALIGCGRIAPNHIKAARENNLEITALCDTNPDHIEDIVKRFSLPENIRRFTDYRDLIAAGGFELAAVATESGYHAEIALALIDAGVNVIVEKPIAMSIADADEIVRRSEQRGVVVSACHQNRFNIAIQQLRGAIDDGRFGRISHAAVNVRWWRDRDYYAQAPWRGTWKLDGGTLMNQCIHGIDLLRWMLESQGQVTEVYGTAERRMHDYIEGEDIGMAVVKTASGAVATIEGTTNTYKCDLEETLSVFGENGMVKIGGTSTNKIDLWKFADMRDDDRDRTGYTEGTENVYGNGHTSLYANVIGAVRDNRRPYVTARDGRNALEMVLAVYKSAKTGLPVKLPLTDFATIDMTGIFD